MLALPEIEPIANPRLEAVLRSKLSHKTKPPGSLGEVEALALQLGLIQRDDIVSLRQPQALVFTGDHGVFVEGLSAYSQDVTARMAVNLLNGGAAANVLTRLHGFDLTVVDAGMASEVPPHVRLMPRKIAYGTRNMCLARAMTLEQAEAAVSAGMEAVRSVGGNVLVLGDIGVANTLAATLMLVRLADVRIADAAGRLSPPGVSESDDERARDAHLREVLLRASLRHRRARAPLDLLSAFGGFETAMLTGAMLQAAAERRVVLVDGFVGGAAAMLACELVPAVRDYLVFSHLGPWRGHSAMLSHLKARPLLSMGVWLNEGVGALMAWPTVQFAARVMNEMASFESAGIPMPGEAPTAPPARPPASAAPGPQTAGDDSDTHPAPLTPGHDPHARTLPGVRPDGALD